MRRKFGLLALGASLLAGCMGLREERNLATESLRVPPGATKNYQPRFPEGPAPGNHAMQPQPAPNP